MPQFGGKPKKKSSSDSKRHFTVVIDRGGKGGNNVPPKEHGLYVSSTPSSAARKAVSKLCASNKSKKVQFHIREITQGSKKKTYGPYIGHIEKLKEPIKLKGRVIKYKPIAKLIAKKGGMKGGSLGDNGKNLKYDDFLIRQSDTPLNINTEFSDLKPKVIKDGLFLTTKYIFFGGPILFEEDIRIGDNSINYFKRPVKKVYKYYYRFVIFHNNDIRSNTGKFNGLIIYELTGADKMPRRIHLVDDRKSNGQPEIIQTYRKDFENLINFIEDERRRRNKPNLNYFIYPKLIYLFGKNSQNSQYSQYSQNSQSRSSSKNSQRQQYPA